MRCAHSCAMHHMHQHCSCTIAHTAVCYTVVSAFACGPHAPRHRRARRAPGYERHGEAGGAGCSAPRHAEEQWLQYRRACSPRRQVLDRPHAATGHPQRKAATLNILLGVCATHGVRRPCLTGRAAGCRLSKKPSKNELGSKCPAALRTSVTTATCEERCDNLQKALACTSQHGWACISSFSARTGPVCACHCRQHVPPCLAPSKPASARHTPKKALQQRSDRLERGTKQRRHTPTLTAASGRACIRLLSPHTPWRRRQATRS